ncbi:hypothetical protein V1524DRAFT_408414 [Lipomyces starkeyi]
MKNIIGQATILGRDNEESHFREIPDRIPLILGTLLLSKNIDQGVVDPELRVHGAKNLRVVDASIIAFIPNCRIQNCVYMIGEK